MIIEWFPGWGNFFEMILTCFWWSAAAIIALIPLVFIAGVVWIILTAWLS